MFAWFYLFSNGDVNHNLKGGTLEHHLKASKGICKIMGDVTEKRWAI